MVKAGFLRRFKKSLRRNRLFFILKNVKIKPMQDTILNVYKVLGLGGFAFFLGVALTPILTHYLYKYKLWRKDARTTAPDGSSTPIFNQLHKERETKAPRMGGILIWATTIILALIFWVIPRIFPEELFLKLNFLSREQTWVPLGILFAGALVGLLDDFMLVFQKGTYRGGGLTFTRRIVLVTLIAALGAYWFYFKLGKDFIFIPGLGDFHLGIYFIPFFILVMWAVFSGGVIDGLDGLSGGVFASIFSAYASIAFFQNQINLATLASVIVGSILAFLWFNIPPARFYMSETGIMALTTTLTAVAFLTNAVFVLPIIALPLVLESLSVIIQLGSKRFFGRKIFLVAPIHHHFEALGWPAEKVTMRFWILSAVAAVLGMILHLMGQT
ncbi:MAG: Phospho-N-acetylmuramoyl-pentapeptide-transferase [Candidatus Giovannonibacteria bacterium GW2011_GWB1_44_23]|uniref:Phospho-N-acetylmuramoyl-pentapeptide-transferase n=2 Tax=Candidatus Giovannoniibacteriota TaxID=1752738 RepID=A0A0G1LUF9_9BACT|nr:MAG: Phospho-N-acetylmuramoyl-pentapeptide-transferase [Candidatus Giovannonibacteria bacterium GW2011_GWB1_44_23]KKT63349.1 MAG: Phospho-N-acetylmuramoyl-pentapeptide-transferase [Candidatus Giovannonibacteria bacterium GW2011_GWA1_44_29]